MLPIKIKPYKNESFTSWFSRLSFLNGSDTKGLALYIWGKHSQLYKDLDRQLSNEQIVKVEKYTSASYSEIQNSTLEPYIKKVNSSQKDIIYNKWYFLLPLGQKGRIRTNGTAICSKCLNNKQPFINKYWRISWMIACPRHRLKLTSHCPNCNQAILPQKLSYLTPKIYLCNNCNYDLRKIRTIIINNTLLKFQNKLLSIFKKGTFSHTNRFNLLTTDSVKDLFLTLNILLAFFHKVLRQKNRFKYLITELKINDNYKFTKENNATYNRLNINDRTKLLHVVSEIFNLNINKFIEILKKTNITANILKQTFKNISPTIKYISKHLSNKKLVRNNKRNKCKLTSKNKQEINKLLLDLNKYINNSYKYEELRNKLILQNRNINNYKKEVNQKKKLSRPKISHQILLRRVVYIINNLNDKSLTTEYILKTLIGYFHWIEVQSSSYILKFSKKKGFIIYIGENDFYIPF